MKVRNYLGVMAALGMLVSTSQQPASAVEHAKRHNMPPAIRMMEPGPMVGGPGPGVLTPETIPADLAMRPAPTVQVLFNQPQSMQIIFDIIGDNTFTSDPLIVPGRLEFGQGGIYRLKLTNIQGREGVELYPTLEIGFVTPRTAAYLAHSALPVQFTEEDFDQALSGNFVTKVIYLPDPDFQGEALAGIDTLVSTRLEKGQDPIIEADRRGTILAITRLGNKDVELAGPSMVGGGIFMGDPNYCPPGMAGAVAGGLPGIVPGGAPGMVSGVTVGQYGMPQTGTPIGLVGPPHIPLGIPTGLQSHKMVNRTPMHLPDPVSNVKIGVRQTPGQSYPQPASRVHIHENNVMPGYPTGRPLIDQGSRSATGSPDANYGASMMR